MFPMNDSSVERERSAVQFCGFCKHYAKRAADAKDGQCRRFPPQVVPAVQVNQISGKVVQGVQCFYPGVTEQTPSCAEFVYQPE